MRNNNLGFAQRILSNTSFALLDLFLTKAGTTIIFILLVRLLPENDIAAIGICAGYMAFIAYFEIGPIRALLRDYPKIVDDEEALNRLLTALFLFLLVQIIAMLALCFGLSSFVLSKLNIPILSFLFFGMTIDFISLTFQDWIKTIFFSSFQQSKATKISFFLTIARLFCYVILFIDPSLNNYVMILIGTSAANGLVWWIAFRKRFRFYPILDRRIPGILLSSLHSYGIWDHFNRMVIDTLFLIDTAVLSWVAYERLVDIGNYTIALKFTSLLFLIPMQICRSLQVALSNYDADEKPVATINAFIRWNFIISISQLLFVLVFGNWLIHVLFGANVNRDVVRYAIIITFGVTIMNFGWPLIGIINTYCKIYKVFLMVFLPSLVIGVSIYFWTAITWGATGVAFGNIFIYCVLSLGLLIFTIYHYPFTLNVKLLTDIEKQFLSRLHLKDI